MERVPGEVLEEHSMRYSGKNLPKVSLRVIQSLEVREYWDQASARVNRTGTVDSGGFYRQT